jgi:type VI secretion system protein ImpF
MPEGYVEATQSVLTYGLPDISQLGPAADRSMGRLRQVLERVIRTFEPRLTNVVVTLPQAGDQAEGRKPTTVRLHVDARLVMDPSPDQVSFDVVMAVDSGRYEVKDRG